MGTSVYDNMDFESKFAKAVIDLRKNRPFYSAIYEGMERVDRSDIIKTMAVSSKQVLYNKNFINELTYPEFLFVNLHELCHIALMHVSRRHNRDPKLFNIAGDLYINKLLSEEFNIKPGHHNPEYNITFPLRALYLDCINLETESTEDIYEELLKNYNKDDKTTSFRGFKMGIGDVNIVYDIIDDGLDPIEQENNAKRIISEAIIKHQLSAGTTSCKLLKEVNKLIQSHVDWRKWLTKYCIKAISKDSTYNIPDKRMYYQKAIYPGNSIEESNTIRNVKICIDTSGSIGAEELEYIFGHIYKITKQYNVEAEVISWDTDYHICGKIKDIKNPNELISLDLTGGGGTDPSCMFEYFDSKNCKEKPIVTLVFTDGYFNFKAEPSWKRKYKNTLWVLTKNGNKNFKPEFGLDTKIKYN